MNSVPAYHILMLPILKLMGTGNEMSIKQMRDAISKNLCLSEAALVERLENSTQTIFYNRMGWATTYLFKAGLLERPRRANYIISEAGKKVLENPPNEIDVNYLKSFEQFGEFQERTKNESETNESIKKSEDQLTPEEQVEKGVRRIQIELQNEILDRVKRLPYEGFEQLVLRLLVGMGYGGSMADVQGVVKGSDGGVDGVVNQDHLGLDRIYIQAKKWEGQVGSPVIQAFAGALDFVGAKKGVIMTTSKFSQPAQDYVKQIKDKRIILVDGERMSMLMLKHEIGVSQKQNYIIQRMDEDFFIELEE